jgi:hypothetical protein
MVKWKEITLKILKLKIERDMIYAIKILNGKRSQAP